MMKTKMPLQDFKLGMFKKVSGAFTGETMMQFFLDNEKGVKEKDVVILAEALIERKALLLHGSAQTFEESKNCIMTFASLPDGDNVFRILSDNAPDDPIGYVYNCCLQINKLVSKIKGPEGKLLLEPDEVIALPEFTRFQNIISDLALLDPSKLKNEQSKLVLFINIYQIMSNHFHINEELNTNKSGGLFSSLIANPFRYP